MDFRFGKVLRSLVIGGVVWSSVADHTRTQFEHISGLDFHMRLAIGDCPSLKLGQTLAVYWSVPVLQRHY